VTLGRSARWSLGTLGVLWTLTQLTPNPTADPAIALTTSPGSPGSCFLPLHLRGDRHRQRLDVQDDPG
jgi:hypothetical protein